MKLGTNTIQTTQAHANIDAFYGPYESIQIACERIPEKYRLQGLTIGIIDNGKIVEYQWKTNNLSTYPEKKDADLLNEIQRALTAEQLIINTKLDNIADLETIRSGAAAGATAQQPATTLGEYGITDAYTKSEGLTLENTVGNRLDTLDAAIELLNGSEVIVVDDHTVVTTPDSQKIYRLLGTTSYTDWMYQDNTWKEIATYDFPGIDDEPTADSDRLVKSGGVAKLKDEVAFTSEKYYINENGTFSNSSGYLHTSLEVREGEIYYLTTSLSEKVRVAFATSAVAVVGQPVSIVEGTEIMSMPIKNKYYKFVIPAGCTHFIFNSGINYGTKCFRRIDVIDYINTITDNAPNPDSENFVKSGGIYKCVNLCNIPEINNYIADIVLKEGVDVPESSIYVDLASIEKVLYCCCYESNNHYINRLQVVVNNNYITLFNISYNTLEEAQNALGTLIEGVRCYVVLRNIGSVNKTINKQLIFNKDVSWSSLNEHPIIKELLIEQTTTNFYTKSEVDEKNANGNSAYKDLNGSNIVTDVGLTLRTYWRHQTNTRSTNISGWCSNDDTDCKEGDIYFVTGTGGANGKLWVLRYADGTIHSMAEDNEVRNNYAIVIPEGVTIFQFSSKSNVSHELKKQYYNEGLKEKVLNIQGDVADIQEEMSNIPVSVSKLYNIPVNIKKADLRILDLGNSYTNDAIHYLTNILNAAGITKGFSLYDCIRSASSFRDWVNMYKKSDNANYKVDKVCGDSLSGVITGNNSGLDNSWFVNLLKVGWDIIIIHQESTHSADYDSWTKSGAAGGLTEYLRILKTYCPQATIGFYLVHSRPSFITSTVQGGNNSVDRWQNIANAVKKLKSDYGIDFIIPYGTAVQNLRMTSLNGDDPVDSTNKKDFSADGLHLASGIGDYVAACAYFESLFAPRYDVTVLGNSYTNESIPVPQEGDSDYYQGRGIPVQISAANALLAQRAAVLAVNDRFNLNNPETDSFIPANTDTKTVYAGNDELNTSGTFANKPTDVPVGFRYFRIDGANNTKYPIYYGGSSKWYDADGNEITQ